MTKEEIRLYIAWTNRYKMSVEILGAEATDRMIEEAFKTDCTPVICYNCPYQNECRGKDIVPWLLRCGKYDDYKRAHEVDRHM